MRAVNVRVGDVGDRDKWRDESRVADLKKSGEGRRRRGEVIALPALHFGQSRYVVSKNCNLCGGHFYEGYNFKYAGRFKR